MPSFIDKACGTVEAQCFMHSTTWNGLMRSGKDIEVLQDGWAYRGRFVFIDDGVEEGQILDRLPEWLAASRYRAHCRLIVSAALRVAIRQREGDPA